VRHLTWATAFALLLVLPAVALLVWRHAPHVVTNTPPVLGTLGAGGAGAPVGPPRGGATGVDRATALLAIWLAGVACVVFQAAVGYRTLRVLRRASGRGAPRPVDVAALRARIGARRRVELRTSTGAAPATPMTWGLVRPAILLPRDSATWSDETMEAVLLHELAHVRRLDAVSQSCALAACAIHWFNPLVWRAASRMREEAEQAADDAVLHAGLRPSAYAAELLRFATMLSMLSPQRRQLATVSSAIVAHGRLDARIRAILSPGVNRRGATRAHGAHAVACCLAATLLLSSSRLSIEPESGAPVQGRTRPAGPVSVTAPARAKPASRGSVHRAARAQRRTAAAARAPRSPSLPTSGADVVTPPRTGAIVQAAASDQRDTDVLPPGIDIRPPRSRPRPAPPADVVTARPLVNRSAWAEPSAIRGADVVRP
jgi:beta-lactamase regulating signal transducer with metallopeptidase domain